MPPPTQRELFVFFIPLALSGIFFPLATPAVNAALARSADPEVALAGFAVVRSLSTLLISPLFGLRQVTTALVMDQGMYQAVRLWSWRLGGGATVLLLAISVPAVYRFIVEEVMAIPGPIARIGPPVMAVVAFSPLLVVGRGFYQALLVRYGRTGPVGTAALGYLLGTAVLVVAGVSWGGLEGALTAALAYFGGQVVYLAMVWQPSRQISRALVPQHSDEVKPHQRQGSYVILFFLPIAISNVLTMLGEPLLQAGMARVPLTQESLAAYPVGMALIWLGGVPLWNIQQLVIAKVRDRVSYKVVGRFVGRVGLSMSVVLGVLALPGPADFLFGTLMGVEGTIKALAVEAYRWLLLTPVLMGARSFYFGVLIARDRPGPIRSAAMVRVLVLFAALVAGVWSNPDNGVRMAAWATMAAAAAEVLCLHFSVRRLVW